MVRVLMVLLAVLAVIVIARAADRVITTTAFSLKEANVPNSTKTISYILLIALMFGVVTGWLGGL